MDNFYDTAKRMYKSSETLHNNSEYHNACYLGGYVIECYAKIIVGVFTTNTPRSFGHRIGNLDSELQNILSGNSSLSSYILNGPTDFNSVLSYWNPVDLRYIDSVSSISTQNMSDNFQSEIQAAMQKLAQMELDGHTLI